MKGEGREWREAVLGADARVRAAEDEWRAAFLAFEAARQRVEAASAVLDLAERQALREARDSEKAGT